MKLVIADGAKSRTLETGRYLLGRSPECDVAFSGAGSESVSWNHAEIHVRAEGAFLTDLQSSNGTWLNGRRIPVETKILDGDEIRLGQSGPTLRVKKAEETAAPVTAAPAAATAGNAFAKADSRQPPKLPERPTGSKEPPGHPVPAAEPAGEERRSSTTRAMLINLQKSQRGWRGLGIAAIVCLCIALIVSLALFAARQTSDAQKREDLAKDLKRKSRTSELDPAAIADLYRQSVFLVARMQGDKVVPVGTSFVVDAKGVFGTNAHVTEEVKRLLRLRQKVYVIGEAGKRKFDVLAATSHPDYKPKLPPKHFSPDVGLLKVRMTNDAALRPVELGDQYDLTGLKDGTKLCYIGFPVYMGAAGGDVMEYRTLDEVKPRVESGNVVRLLTLNGKVGKPETQLIMEHNMQSWGGASGSPIFNRSGRVVALHFAANNIIHRTKTGIMALRSPSGTKFGIRVDKLQQLIDKQVR